MERVIQKQGFKFHQYKSHWGSRAVNYRIEQCCMEWKKRYQCEQRGKVNWRTATTACNTIDGACLSLGESKTQKKEKKRKTRS